jgi:bla regulator protein blaR1
MTTYLLGSGLSLLVLLGFYRLSLENQPMHRLKRAYLLGTLLVSLVAPLLRVEVAAEQVPFSHNVPVQLPRQASGQAMHVPDAPPDADYRSRDWLSVATFAPLLPFATSLFVLGTLVMLFRFGRNLYRLWQQVRMAPTLPFRGATLVLMPGNALPHTFLHYLFVSKTAYEQGDIAPELLTHELAHIRQRHSLDVLLLELVLCAGWFNPLLWWLKKAAQRNHEFLADEAVNRAFGNVPAYQHLLLSALSHTQPAPALASTLTFQTTKQRLLMMTKTTNSARTAAAAFGATLLLGLAAALLSMTTAPAQVPPAKPAKTAATPPNAVSPTPIATGPGRSVQFGPEEMERRFGNKKVMLSNKTRKAFGLKTDQPLFSELPPALKKTVYFLPPDAPRTPTEAQWQDFKNTKKYGIWVDEKRRRDNPMAKYNREDIVYFWYSYVHKNARQPEEYLYQLELYTKAGYEKYLNYFEENPMLSVAPNQAKAAGK